MRAAWLVVVLLCFCSGCTTIGCDEGFIFVLGSELQYSRDNQEMEKIKGDEYTEFPYDTVEQEKMK